jgi:hypothetical protein
MTIKTKIGEFYDFVFCKDRACRISNGPVQIPVRKTEYGSGIDRGMQLSVPCHACGTAAIYSGTEFHVGLMR